MGAGSEDEKTKHRRRKSMNMLVIGLLMVIAGCFFLIRKINFVNRADTVRAEITRIDSWYDSDDDPHHTVYVAYEYKGESYNKTLPEYSISMREGDELDIYVDPQKPDIISSTGMAYLGPAACILMGAVFMGLDIYASMKKKEL